MSQGNYREAAEMFLELAESAKAHDHPRAAHLYLQAGRSLALDGQIDAGSEGLHTGLGLLADQGQVRRLHVATDRIVQELEQQGYHAHASVIRDQYGTHQMAGSQISAAPGTELVSLPEKCSSCGGTVHPEEVKRVGADKALCDYCGSVISPE